MVSDIIIGGIIAAIPGVIAAVFAILEYRDKRKHRSDLTSSTEMIVDVKKENKGLLEAISRLKKRVQADEETKRMMADLKRQEQARKQKALNWKMFTDAGKLLLGAYKAGVFDEFFAEEEEYDE